MPTFGGDTKKAKKAELYVAAIAVVCPHCKAPCGAPDNGSDLWEPAHVELALGQTRQCFTCKESYYLPTVVASVRMP